MKRSERGETFLHQGALGRAALSDPPMLLLGGQAGVNRDRHDGSLTGTLCRGRRILFIESASMPKQKIASEVHLVYVV